MDTDDEQRSCIAALPSPICLSSITLTAKEFESAQFQFPASDSQRMCSDVELPACLGRGRYVRGMNLWNPLCHCTCTILPDELIIFRLFPWLDIGDLLAAASVCRRFHFLAGDKTLWRSVDLTPYRTGVSNIDMSKLLFARAPSIRNLKLCRLPFVSTKLLQDLAGRASQLRELHLCFAVGITDDAIVALAQFSPLLERVSLEQCVGLTDVSVVALAQGCRRLAKLDVRRCTLLTGRSLLALSQSSKHLEHFNASHCVAVTEEALLTLSSSCSRLRTLRLHGCFLPSRNFISRLQLALLHLEELDISSSNPFVRQSCVSDADLLSMGRAWGSRLVRLTLFNRCSHITDDGVTALGSACPQLLSLDLGGASKVTNAGIDQLTICCPRLTSLRLSGCIALTDDAIVSIANRSKQLSQLDLHGCALLRAESTHRQCRQLPLLRKLILPDSSIVSYAS
eukprot:GILJ01010238.1.p1 GENE.GILJ01010238.1~~GILJ01010238.1.p1  ORF type:complete len:481 (+),score=32.45 GILJ01010238.1:84-1445(+)